MHTVVDSRKSFEQYMTGHRTEKRSGMSSVRTDCRGSLSNVIPEPRVLSLGGALRVLVGEDVSRTCFEGESDWRREGGEAQSYVRDDRSSSPASSDSLSDGQPTPFQPVDFSAWLHPFSPDSESAPWNNLDHAADVKFDDSSLLMLEELANDGVFEYVSFFSPSAAQESSGCDRTHGAVRS